MTIDVTDAPDARAGRRVTLIGDGISVDDVAAAAARTATRILTSLGGRYQRQVING